MKSSSWIGGVENSTRIATHRCNYLLQGAVWWTRHSGWQHGQVTSESETSSTPPASVVAPLIPAATVVLLREGDGAPEVLLLQRNSGRGAFAGYWVFPGGRVDDDDFDDVACAVREAAEETGLAVDPSALVRWSHWTPPVTEPRRFGTWFFLAPVGPQSDVTVDEGEIVGHAWLTPAEALRRRDVGEVQLAPPTFVTLTCLSEFGSMADALSHASSKEPDLFQTTMIKEDGQFVVAWDPDAALADGANLSTEGPRHRIHMNGPGPWVYERPSSSA